MNIATAMRSIVPCTVCKVLSSGIVLVIDITWDPTWYDLIGSLRANNVPYIHIDISIKPFARAFFKFIDYIGSYDVAMVLQNEKGNSAADSWEAKSLTIPCMFQRSMRQSTRF